MSLFFAQNVSDEIKGYGYLYNYYTVAELNFAPLDWKVPVKSEVDTLIASLGGASVAGGKMKERGLDHWDQENITDPDSGFLAYGGGQRNANGTYVQLNEYGFFCVNENAPGDFGPWNFNLRSYNSFIGTNANVTFGYAYGHSVRLLYTGSGTPTTVTDNDGNVYDVVQIGVQYWTVQNWKCTTLSDGTAIPNITNNTDWFNLTTLGRCAYNNDESNV